MGYVKIVCASWDTVITRYAESILVLPSLGLQLETHRGLPNIPLFVSKRFIPLMYLQDFVINEGLRGWNVRYYLTAIQNSDDGKKSLEVAYEVRRPSSTLRRN